MLFALAILLPILLRAGISEQYPESMYQEMRWRMIGPYRGGRTRAAVGVPTQPNLFYMAQVNGGVWKSDDYGRTWNPIFDTQPTQSIGAIAVSPSDPRILYVASGEGLARPDVSIGDGIYKSTDAGKTWTHLGLRTGQQVPELAVDPRDPNRVFAAVLGHPYGPSDDRGIYRSTDGGLNWTRVLYKNPNTGGCDIALDPSNPDIVYACLWQIRQGPWEDRNQYDGTDGGLFKSTDGGNTWRQLTNGLPKDLVQTHIAIAPSDPRRIYVIVSTTEPGDYASGSGLGVFRSDDAGESWRRITEDGRPAYRIGGGDLPVPRVDPKNPDIVYSASIVTMKSIDGGKTWSSLRGAPGGDDYQNLWINPLNPDIILLVSDQGAIVTVNGGRTWSSWYNQPTAQIYHVSVTPTFPYRVCGGQQESGSVCISSRGNDGQITIRDWHPVGVIEYGYVAPDPLHPELVYGAGRNEVSKFNWKTYQVQNVTPLPVRNGKYRVDRTEPILFSPVDPRTLYYAANVVFKTTDGGETWREISPDLTREKPGIPASIGEMAAKDPKAATQRGAIYALAPSHQDVNTLWAGTDDGQVWITRDGGNNWRNITPSGLIPWSKVTQIDASHFDDQSAYVSVSRFRIDDLHPYIYRTHDGGKSWQQITTDLPDDAPVDTVREDPMRKGLLFAGTEKAVWVSFDDGDHWQSLQLNLPHSSMRDLWIHQDDLIVGTHGRSFWILDDITPLRQLAGEVAESPAHLFSPAAAYRIERDTNSDTPWPPDEPTAENPPNGAIVDYHLAKAASEAVTLEILDSKDNLVRRYSSADPPPMSAEEMQKQLVPPYWRRPWAALPAGPGMHRWVWDLRYPAPSSAEPSYPISAVPHDTPRVPLGPRALPGQYTVRLTAGGKTYTNALTVKMDPRLDIPTSGLEQQFRLQMRLASAMNRITPAVSQAHALSGQLKKTCPSASGDAAEACKALQKKLDVLIDGTPGASAREPTLNGLSGAVGPLYEMVDRSDAVPTPAQTDAADQIERELGPLMLRWDQLKSMDLPKLNDLLRRSGLPELQPDANPKTTESPSHEE